MGTYDRCLRVTTLAWETYVARKAPAELVANRRHDIGGVEDGFIYSADGPGIWIVRHDDGTRAAYATIETIAFYPNLTPEAQWLSDRQLWEWCVSYDYFQQFVGETA